MKKTWEAGPAPLPKILRQGSSIIFDRENLAPFLASGAVVSLCDALKWVKNFPALPPVEGKTIVVCGLEAMVEILDKDEAEAFLEGRIRPLLKIVQDRWTACGVVLGFSASPKKFEENPMLEEVIFKRRDRSKVYLSEGLWDGSSTVNMRRIIDPNRKSCDVIGYHVTRIS